MSNKDELVSILGMKELKDRIKELEAMVFGETNHKDYGMMVFSGRYLTDSLYSHEDHAEIGKCDPSCCLKCRLEKYHNDFL